MSEPIVSVIIPCYKGEKYIGPCIEMILSQSYKNLEVIVIIDGIFDRSEEIASLYPVKTILFKKNRGPSVVRNTGIAMATGKYIHFMDVDDKINSDFYKNLVNAAEKTGADIACSGMYNEKLPYQTQVFKKNRVVVKTRDKLKLTWVARWGYVWRYLFNLEFLRGTGILFEEGRLIEDMPFSFKVLYMAPKIVTATDALYFYANVPGSTLNNKTEIMQKKTTDDSYHANEVISNFAKDKGIRMPGRSKDIDKLHYSLRKLRIKTFGLGSLWRYIAKMFPEQEQTTASADIRL